MNHIVEYSEYNFLLKHPFTCVIAGPTSSGKTELVRSILSNWSSIIHIDQPKDLRVMWCFGIYQQKYQEPIKSCLIYYREGLPKPEEIGTFRPDIVIIDDLMSESADDREISSYFTRGSHHFGFSIILILQNFFTKGKEMRNISLNAHYIFLMKNRRDLRQITLLGSQLFPGKSKAFMEVYKDSTSDPFGYLLIDMKQETSEEFRLRTSIIPVDNIIKQTVYEIK